MAWTGWILASAAFLALYDLAKKASVRANAVLPVLFVSSGAGAAAFLSAALAGGRFAAFLGAGRTVVAFAAAKALIVAASWIFTFRALRTLPITIATPVRASAPAMVFVLAFFLYGERPGAVQGLGMLAAFAGYWLFSWAGRHEGIDFFRSRAVWCAIAGAVLSAGSSVFDKYVFQVRALGVGPVQFWFQIFLVLTYGVLFAARRLLPGAADRFEWRRTIPCVGVLLAMADWLYFNGLSRPGTPIAVASLLRRVSVAITFVLGAICFRETNLARKAIAASAILLGAVLMAL